MLSPYVHSKKINKLFLYLFINVLANPLYSMLTENSVYTFFGIRIYKWLTHYLMTERPNL